MHADHTLLIALGALLVLSPLVKGSCTRLGIPSLVGYILLGFAVRLIDERWQIASAAFDATFAILAQLGVVALLFRVGLKSHVHELLAKLPDASLIWLGNVLLSLVLGFAVARYPLGLPLETSLVVATALSATSVAVSVAVWDEMRWLDSSAGQLLIDVAELDDLSAVLLLAVLLALIPNLQGDPSLLLPSVGGTLLGLLARLLLFVAGCYLFALYIESAFTRLARRWHDSGTGLAISVLGAGLSIAVLADYLGFSLAIGALFAGLAFSRDPQAVATDAKFIDFYELLTPFFFIYIGMQLPPDAILPSLGLAAALLPVAVLGKFVGAGLPALRVASRADALRLGLSMVPRAEIAMVVIHQCRQFGTDVVPDRVFAAMILLAVATSVLAPIALRRCKIAG